MTAPRAVYYSPSSLNATLAEERAKSVDVTLEPQEVADLAALTRAVNAMRAEKKREPGMTPRDVIRYALRGAAAFFGEGKDDE